MHDDSEAPTSLVPFNLRIVPEYFCSSGDAYTSVTTMDALMGLTLIRAADGSHARFVGQGPETESRWQANGHLWSEADCGISVLAAF